MQQQIQHGFEELKAEVKQELIGDKNLLSTMQTNQTETSAAQNNGLRDVDMMDVAELEKERGDQNERENMNINPQEQEDLERVRLQRQALTFEQKCLIEKIIDEKTAAFTH